ncbi:MAG: hypothetical protein OXS29_07330 [bacterium]|nr:hypothetical protein [bacterium]MDE0289943.1 hypothetical protein [bacterium]MDE0437904.1 hypothetical protein [bacterium]
MGSTSLVRQHQRRLEDTGRTSYYINAGWAEDMSELVAEIRISVGGPRPPKYAGDPIERFMASRVLVREGDDRLRGLRALSTRVAESEGPRPIIILDEMHEPELVHELFGCYRDDIWQMPFRWVVCGQASRRSQYLQPPADAFFDSVLTLDALDQAASQDLLHTRLAGAGVDDEEAGLRILANRDRIVRQGGGNPRQLLAAARDVVLRSAEETSVSDRLVASAAALGATEMLAVRYLTRHGPTSASDARLLEALDITRARATQVLRRLEDAGLVRASNAKANQPGRPRRLYSTRSSLEGV